MPPLTEAKMESGMPTLALLSQKSVVAQSGEQTRTLMTRVSAKLLFTLEKSQWLVAQSPSKFGLDKPPTRGLPAMA
jgi:hypothetical protein